MKTIVIKSVFSLSDNATLPPTSSKKKKEPTPTKKQKAETKKPEPPPEAPKKIGRPTNEEIKAKKQKFVDSETELRELLLQRQLAAPPDAIRTATKEEAPDPDNWIPKYPIFLWGQRVRTTMFGVTYKGTVVYDRIESALAEVAWDDGSIQYAAKMNLVPIKKRKYQNVFKQERAVAKRVPSNDPQRAKRTRRTSKEAGCGSKTEPKAS